MKLSDLEFDFPEKLVATEPGVKTRVMWVDGEQPAKELTLDGLVEKFSSGDVLVVNDTKVLKRRVFCERKLEVLFLDQLDQDRWQVLMPLSRIKKKTEFELPGGVVASVLARGRPQEIRTSRPLDAQYFEEYGAIPLPPYIQKARGEREPTDSDQEWYQTSWASEPGSLAAPTAGLHFKSEHIHRLKERGVHILYTTLHVGLGTFLEIATDDLDDHEMHFESVHVKKEVWAEILELKKRGGRVWALGTTVTRTLESLAREMIPQDEEGHFFGETNLFIQPGSEFRVVDRLLTNFHQPRSTLLALVGAFAGLDRVKESYRWAINNEFKLFSYGDLTAWSK